MAAERPKRSNAGNRMGKLVKQEINQDEFYTTAYGGFDEASGDEEYETEEEADDVVDSDFDLSEKEDMEGGDKEEDIQPKPKKRKWIKPYKVENTKSATKERRVQRHKKTEIAVASDSTLERRSLRKSTIDLAKERERHRQDEERRRHKTTAQSLGQSKKCQRLSQDQLLREAKRTEVKNLASLESYRLQSEKKTYKEKKHTLQGSIIRYHSMIMPTVALSSPTATHTDSMHTTLEQPVDGKYSRNFIIFTDNDLYCNTFSYPCPTRPKRVYCSVTGLPAKYVDPLTKLPYATAQAFRIIRNRYVKEKEDKCEARIVQLNNWLEEKKKLKKQNC